MSFLCSKKKSCSRWFRKKYREKDVKEGQRELKDEGPNILNSSADVILMIKSKMTT
jgi:hypothetical protein